MNAATPLADLDSQWLLLANSQTVVHLWLVNGKLGYIDRSSNEPNRWIWLNEEALSRMRPISDARKIEGIQPNLELED